MVKYGKTIHKIVHHVTFVDDQMEPSLAIILIGLRCMLRGES
jgi:hypothetical protein